MELETSENPWRNLFETVRGALHNRRDARGVVGSINWLRQGMAERGAKPNVVRNIIYRNKGKLADKRVLFELLSELWQSTGGAPLRAPEIALLLNNPPDEGDVAQLLGRDKRRIYTGFVGAVQAGRAPKLLLTGRPGSGKTLLTDYVQRALEQSPADTPQVVRQEFSAVNLADALLHLSLALGGAAEGFGAKLAKVGVAGAYSVQADAQAGVARFILEQLRNRRDPLLLLLHVSQSVGSALPGAPPGTATLGDVPLRLNTPDVPRVGLTEWLWHTLLGPLAQEQVSLLVSMAELPLPLLGRADAFEGPVKLSPPTTAEARRFVRALAPQLAEAQQEDLVAQAKRSFEDLRTLTLLAEAREPPGSGRYTEQLGQLVAGGSGRLRDFLTSLAVLSLPEFPAVTQGALEALRSAEPKTLSSLELAFLDPVPGEPAGEPACWRPFSRQFARTLRSRLRAADPARFRSLSRAASLLYEDDAHRAHRSDVAGRYVHHLFAARGWAELSAWAERAPIPQSLMQRLWRTAQTELAGDLPTLNAVALQVASYYVRLGSLEHPDALGAFDVLAAADDAGLQGWVRVKRAENALQQGRFEEAEALLDGWREAAPGDPPNAELRAEVALLRANLARWHSRLSDAAALARSSLDALAQTGALNNPLLAVRVGLWAGLVAKDAGDLTGALAHFRDLHTEDELFCARIRFQEADVLLGLGHLAEAHAALDEAVNSSAQAEAPAFEQARYLARRGTLARRRGEFSAAQRDFSAAQTVLLETEAGPFLFRLEFERAKVNDEAALGLLAEGRTDDAIATLQENQETFAAYGERYGVDPSFRILRSRLRLAAAYSCRAFSASYRLPLGPYAEDALPTDLTHARGLVTAVLGSLSAEPGRYAGLLTQAQLGSSLVLAPAAAAKQAAAALSAARYPYARGRAGAHLAGARLRCGDPGGAQTAVKAAMLELQGSTDDYAVCAYLSNLDAAALLCLGNVQEAHERILSALQNSLLTPYHAVLLRRFGRFAERLGVSPNAAALGLGDAPLPPTLRPADALALRLRQQLKQRGVAAESSETSRQ